MDWNPTPVSSLVRRLFGLSFAACRVDLLVMFAASSADLPLSAAVWNQSRQLCRRTSALSQTRQSAASRPRTRTIHTNACRAWHASVSHPLNPSTTGRCWWTCACLSVRCCFFNNALVLFIFFFFFVFLLRPTRRTPRGRPRWQVSRFSCRSSWRANRCRRRWPSSSTRGNGFVSDTTATNIAGCRLTATVLTNSLSRVSDVELLEEPEKPVILLIISSGKI